MDTYMITWSRKRDSIELCAFLQWCLENDIKKWIIGKETGTYGRKHWQIRLQTRYSFEVLKAIFGNEAHIEKCSDTWEYERKEGEYYASDDTTDRLKVRYGELNRKQKTVLEKTRKQNDREITVWYDPVGYDGKSWFCNYLHEKGIGFYCPPFLQGVKEITQYIASGYRGEEIIVIDLPRVVKWKTDLYASIETIKDGLVCDSRYHAQTRNIRGVKVLVLTNTYPRLDKLSADRWDIIKFGGTAS